MVVVGKEVKTTKSETSIVSYVFNDCGKLTSLTFQRTNGWKVGSKALSSSGLSNQVIVANDLHKVK